MFVLFILLEVLSVIAFKSPHSILQITPGAITKIVENYSDKIFHHLKKDLNDINAQTDLCEFSIQNITIELPEVSNKKINVILLEKTSEIHIVIRELKFVAIMDTRVVMPFRRAETKVNITNNNLTYDLIVSFVNVNKIGELEIKSSRFIIDENETNLYFLKEVEHGIVTEGLKWLKYYIAKDIIDQLKDIITADMKELVNKDIRKIISKKKIDNDIEIQCDLYEVNVENEKGYRCSTTTGICRIWKVRAGR